MHTFLRARIYQTPFNRITIDARFIPLPHFSTPSTPARRTKVEYSRQDSRLHNVACNVNPFISLPRPSPLPFLRPLFFPLICGIFSSSLHASISIFARSLRLVFVFQPLLSFLRPSKVEPRRRLLNDRCSYFIAIVERCRVWLMRTSVNYTVNVKKKRGRREGWLSLLCMEDARIYVEVCVTSSNDLRSYFGMRGDRKRAWHEEKLFLGIRFRWEIRIYRETDAN